VLFDRFVGGVFLLFEFELVCSCFMYFSLTLYFDLYLPFLEQETRTWNGVPMGTFDLYGTSKCIICTRTQSSNFSTLYLYNRDPSLE